MSRWGFTSLLLALIIFSPTFVAAQFGGDPESPFTVSVNTDAPRSHSPVTLTPVSGAIDIVNATMTVTINGAEAYTGTARPVAVTVGAAGKITTNDVTMNVGGTRYTQTLSLTPQDVALIAEPIASAPPLYPGKPWVPVDGSVRVVAIADMRAANGAAIDPTSLGYAWSVDDVRALSGSGLGKRTLIIDSPLQYRTRTVTVTVTSPDGSQRGTAWIDLEANEPIMRVYERDPLAGIRFDHALGSSYAIGGSEATLYAAPFAFPTALRAPAIEWYVGGTLTETGSLITLRPTGQGAGSAALSARALGTAGLAASAGLTITYNAEPASGFFGL
jgi:hypothetical protein